MVDMAILRHGGMGRVFDAAYAPSRRPKGDSGRGHHHQVPGLGVVMDEQATAFALARHLVAAVDRVPIGPFLREYTVHLTPGDTEKLLLSVAGMVARDRLERGVKLNYPETVALLTTWVIERARDGRTVQDLMSAGRQVLTREQVMDGVAEMLPDVQVEATFPDGRKLVTIHQPII